MAQFIPGIYNNFYYNILGYFWGVTKKEWVKVVQEEVRSLLENHTFDLVKLPQGKKSLINKWVYRLKTENNGSQLRYEA